MARQPAAQSTNAPTFASVFDAIVANVSRVIHGKEEPIRLALVCLLSEGHLLLEDVPGVGKTTLAKALSKSFDLECRRIQFTPDLLPSDVTGTSVYDRATGSFSFRPGPVFANVVIGDEINRASPKTQSALLEAMQERQVTIETTTHLLPSPFLVIGTQNPIEHEGTYPLPESQLDRFLLRIRMGYPDRDAELTMLESSGASAAGANSIALVESLPTVADMATVPAMIDAARRVHTAAALRGYVVDLATATRNHPALALGMSPRCTLALQGAARTLAAADGRDYVIPDDVKALFGPVVEHRLVLSPEAVVSGIELREVLTDVLRAVAVPSGRAGLAG
ncbi:MAG TPA: MoxR family ATPase [Acidimicrobiales bacterium]|jgi:MoxR-like ATPase|nr:MoxR family ATPase [Acidimicrobiales bacterium]